MKIKVLSNGYEQHAALLQKKINARIPAQWGEGMEIALAVDAAIGVAESYCIVQTANGWQITGADESGLYFGIGKFLHTAKWSETDFLPRPPEGVIAPDCPLRAMYFAVHLHNWYANAPTAQLEQYVEELWLWGYNAIMLIVPVIDLYSFGEENARRSIEKSRAIFRLAKRLGMKVGLFICPNQGLRGAPRELDAEPNFDPMRRRGDGGRNICPHKPGAVDYLRTVWQGMLEQFVDIGLDYMVTWPYDEGGCGCDKCRPWGAKGYLDLVCLLHDEAVAVYPNIQTVISTWTFDKPEGQGEFEALYKRLRTDMSWVDYMMADAHDDYPRYPLEHEVVKPVINFPEISMWKLFPWGGYGANPMPERYQGIWNSAKSVLSGGAPYSEGMYEDISKIQFAGYYWQKDRDWRDILSEYINYEVSGEVVDDVLAMIECIERNHVLVGKVKEPDHAAAAECGRLARAIDARLDARGKQAWRWRVLYIRAIIDEKRFAYYERTGMHGMAHLADIRNFAADFLADDAEAVALLSELRTLYHSEPCNGRNQYTLPFVGEPTRLGNGKTHADILRERAAGK
ncbi:MAG: hypothetical protein E7590_09305 [Ruminococcaceae bacterium]|nr:hypothetical protein [Oscillospiraceae bacterium]